MTTLEKVTAALTRVAGLALFGIIAVTMADVLAKNLLRRPLHGTFEYVELLLVVVVFFGMPEIFRRHANIVVDVVDHFVPKATLQRIILAGALVTLGFLGLLGYAMLSPALDTWRFPERRLESGIRTSTFWIPILIGTVACILAAAVDAWQRLKRMSAGDPT